MWMGKNRWIWMNRNRWVLTIDTERWIWINISVSYGYKYIDGYIRMETDMNKWSMYECIEIDRYDWIEIDGNEMIANQWI